ncbi:MAG: DinB family protein [Acidobacteria bacterium]|nr:DinB family protein [Acidobacteriota bacterium]
MPVSGDSNTEALRPTVTMQIVRSLDEQFARLHERSAALVRAVPPERLYWQPRTPDGRMPVYSCGEHVLRSAAAVEQTFGGITVNLWDDPFEWTLPETLPTPGHVITYLDESEATRRRAFALFRSDAELLQEIAAPSGEMRTLYSLVTETLVRAAHHQGQAFATFRLFSDERLPPV